jgi:hypothetical protein
MSHVPPAFGRPSTEPEPRRPPSVKLAVVLAVLFGPLGLFYASPVGGLFMTFVCMVVGVGTVGVGLLLAWPVCILWAYVAASSYQRPSEKV